MGKGDVLDEFHRCFQDQVSWLTAAFDLGVSLRTITSTLLLRTIELLGQIALW
jgi:hypothetical protein